MQSIAMVTVYKCYEIYYYNIERENEIELPGCVHTHKGRERQIAKR
jgi:hypothetical protein